MKLFLVLTTLSFILKVSSCDWKITEQYFLLSLLAKSADSGVLNFMYDTGMCAGGRTLLSTGETEWIH